MLEAHLKASFSKDPRRQVGSVIVDPYSRSVVASGWNGIPRLVNDELPERSENPEKAFWYAHAEENAICNAAAKGVATRGCSIYVTHFPCVLCARKIIQCGIDTVYVDMVNHDTGNADRHGFAQARQMFEEAGVIVLSVEMTHGLRIEKREACSK